MILGGAIVQTVASASLAMFDLGVQGTQGLPPPPNKL